MSEYQYYEFRAVDRPLTQEQISELRGYSSRAEITPTCFVNVYNWGSFKGNPDEWMEKYFDVFLYLANWGTRQLMFRIPEALLDPETASTYCSEENLSCYVKDDHVILSFRSDEEEYEWAEGEGWLEPMIPLRSDLMHGDHRCLYLGWLLAAQGDELDDDTLEPPVPPGLKELSKPLENLADFLRIDLDLIVAAAEQSGEGPSFGLSKEEIASWVAELPSKDKDAALTRMLEGNEPHVFAELRQRAICEIRAARKSDTHSQGRDRRTVGELLARAEVMAKEREKQEAEEQAREKARLERERAEERKKHIESLVGKEGGLWSEVEKLIATKQPKRYDEAVSVLQDLRDLAAMNGKTSEFSLRINALHSEHTRKTTLVDRFRKAKLLG